MVQYPRVYVIRRGADTGKVLIQWNERGYFLLVDEQGRVEHQYRTAPHDLLCMTKMDSGEVA